jgi:hypothetical protein
MKHPTLVDIQLRIRQYIPEDFELQAPYSLLDVSKLFTKRQGSKPTYKTIYLARKMFLKLKTDGECRHLFLISLLVQHWPKIKKNLTAYKINKYVQYNQSAFEHPNCPKI